MTITFGPLCYEVYMHHETFNYSSKDKAVFVQRASKDDSYQIYSVIDSEMDVIHREGDFFNEYKLSDEYKDTSNKFLDKIVRTHGTGVSTDGIQFTL